MLTARRTNKYLRWFSSARFGYLSASTTHLRNFASRSSCVTMNSENFFEPNLNVCHPADELVILPRLRRFLAIRSRFPTCFLMCCCKFFALSQLPTFDPLSTPSTGQSTI